MKEPRFCLMCGSTLVELHSDGRPRRICSACGWTYYPQLKVGSASLVVDQGRLLLLRRAHQPWQEYWNLPAGYVEADEDPRRAAERETFEECGLQVSAGELIADEFFADDPRGNGLLLVYRCKIVGGTLQTTAESQEACYFSPNEIPEELAGAAHDRTILRWAAGDFD